MKFELCPLTNFEFQNLYRPGEEPDEDDIARRTERYWRPYHAKISDELTAMKNRFGVAVLFDGHTIKSRVPRFFEGRIPDLNLGTANGASCAAELAGQAFSILSGSNFSAVLDDRFTGGYITRDYGRPAENIHALQLELTWRTYMDEDTFGYVPERADRLKLVLTALLNTMIDWAVARSRP